MKTRKEGMQADGAEEEEDVYVHAHLGGPRGKRCGKEKVVGGRRYACQGLVTSSVRLHGTDPRDEQICASGRCDDCLKGKSSVKDRVWQSDLLAYANRGTEKSLKLDLIGYATDEVLDAIEDEADSEQLRMCYQTAAMFGGDKWSKQDRQDFDLASMRTEVADRYDNAVEERYAATPLAARERELVVAEGGKWKSALALALGRITGAREATGGSARGEGVRRS